MKQYANSGVGSTPAEDAIVIDAPKNFYVGALYVRGYVSLYVGGYVRAGVSQSRLNGRIDSRAITRD